MILKCYIKYRAIKKSIKDWIQSNIIDYINITQYVDPIRFYNYKTYLHIGTSDSVDDGKIYELITDLDEHKKYVKLKSTEFDNKVGIDIKLWKFLLIFRIIFYISMLLTSCILWDTKYFPLSIVIAIGTYLIAMARLKQYLDYKIFRNELKRIE